MPKIINLINKIYHKILFHVYTLLKNSYDMYRYEGYREKYEIDKDFHFRGTETILYGNGKIILNSNSYLSRYCILESVNNAKIIIGKNCAIGPYVKMYTVGKKTDQNLNINPFDKCVEKTKGNITIGDGCWIGANVNIKGNVEIGENSIIGMNSVVTKNIPPHSIAVGSPAKVVKFKSYVSQKEKRLIFNAYKGSLSKDLIKELES